MAITEIKNLSKSISIGATGSKASKEVDPAEMAKFTVNPAGDLVTGTGILPATMDASFAVTGDNVQVIWTDEANATHRGVGGKFSLAGDTVTIAALVDVSKYSVGLTGQLEIGPKAGKVATVSVSIGNLNPAHDWIIDFSDKRDGAPGTKIDLYSLIEWIKDKNKEPNASIELPDVKADENAAEAPLDPKKFMIEFKEFYFNITQKTFDFWVQSGAGDDLTFGDFTIKSVGFRVTNVPIIAETQKAIAAPVEKDEE